MGLRADVWGDRRVHLARLVCRVLGHRFGPWSQPIDFKWRGQLLVQRNRACTRCPKTEVDTRPADTLT
jgi:hypothetical protein